MVWDHWVVWNIPAEREGVPEGWSPDAPEGDNDYGERGYGGPNSPDREHTYGFTLYALDAELDLPAGANKDDLEAAVEGHLLASAELRGRYAP